MSMLNTSRELLWQNLPHLQHGSTLPPLLPLDLYPTSPRSILVLCALQLILSTWALGFTSPGSIYRPAVFPIITACTYLIGQTCLDVMPRLMLTNCIAGFACTYWTQYLISALILQENFEDQGPLRKKGKQTRPSHDSVLARIKFGLLTTGSTRNVGTNHEVKGVPHFSKKDPSYVPSRGVFLANRGLSAVFAYLVIDIMMANPPDISQKAVTFSRAKVSFFTRLNEITAEEFKTRVMVSAGQYVGIYLMLTLMHSTISFLAVLSGASNPKEWPPLFGSITEMWSLRQFWGKFWHCMMRYKNESVANWITWDIMRLRKGTLLGRYTQIFFVFMFSGACHVLMDIIGPIPLAECEALQFFLTHTLLFIFEDAVVAAWRKVTGRERTNEEPKVWIKILGAVWVCAVKIWATPLWVYPGLRHAIGGKKAELLPFSISQSFL